MSMTPDEFLALHPHACDDGKRFARQYKTMAEVWDACPRAGWLLWICRMHRVDLDPKAAGLFACACVRTTPLQDGRTIWDLLTDPRSRAAIEAVERFAAGTATREELGAARDAAADAADAYADAAAAAYAAAAAAADAYADAAAAAADAAADAAAAAAAAAYATAAAAAARKHQANELRKRVKNPFKPEGI